MKALAEALRFLTIIPVPGKPPRNVAMVQAAYPLAGLIIGTITAAIAWTASWLLGSSGAAISAVVAGILITGGLHMDGLADLADGLGGGRDREKTLAIMSDSRLGSFGALAIICMFALQAVVIASLFEPGNSPVALVKLVGLLLAAIVSRGIIPLVIALFPSARPGGMGDRNRKSSSVSATIFALLFSIFTGFTILGIAGLVLVVLVTGIVLLVAWRVSRRLGGLSGDVYGALIETGSLLVLTGVLVISRFDLSTPTLL